MRLVWIRWAQLTKSSPHWHTTGADWEHRRAKTRCGIWIQAERSRETTYGVALPEHHADRIGRACLKCMRAEQKLL